MTSELRVVDVEFMPEAKEPGVLYISERFGLAIHLCAGCDGSAVVMKTRPMFDGDQHFWTMTRDGDAVTFTPSILQQGCRHHYFIEASRVRFV